MSTLGTDSQSTSARPSLISGAVPEEAEFPDNQQHKVATVEGHRSNEGGNSFIDAATLKQLQRELDQEIIDSEFNLKVC